MTTTHFKQANPLLISFSDCGDDKFKYVYWIDLSTAAGLRWANGIRVKSFTYVDLLERVMSTLHASYTEEEFKIVMCGKAMKVFAVNDNFDLITKLDSNFQPIIHHVTRLQRS